MDFCSTADREANPDVVCKRSRRCAPPLTLDASYEGILRNQRRRQARTFALLDYLVGTGEKGERDVKAKRLRGFEIDHQIVLSRRLHWQIGGLLAS